MSRVSRVFFRVMSGLSAALICGLGSWVLATEAGTTRVAPIQRNPEFAARAAVLVVPQTADRAPRSAVAHADEAEYRTRLRQLGFEVFVIGPGARPEIDRLARQVVAAVPGGADIAVFVLGQALGDGSDVYVVPADAQPDLEAKAEILGTEGLPLADLMRRLAARGPRSLVAFVDECRRLDRPNEPCVLDAVAAVGASVIAVHRAGRSRSGAPVAAQPSVRAPMLELMISPGTTFLQLFPLLRDRLAGSDAGVSSTAALSPTFVFHPTDFFPRLPHLCNRIDPSADADTVRRTSVDSLVEACAEAIRNWPFVPHFERQRVAGVEQRAFRRAVASCDDPVASTSYIATYPGGRFRPIVEQFIAQCEERRRPPPAPPVAAPSSPQPPVPSRATASSRSGWALTYDPAILRIDAAGNDVYDPRHNSYNTIWQSADGSPVVVFVQASPNSSCADPRSYFDNVMRHRRQRVENARNQYEPSGQRDGVAMSGYGWRSGQRDAFQDLGFVDVIFVGRSDRSTVVHIGARFPSHMASTVRAEIDRMISSFRLPPVDFYRVCPS